MKISVSQYARALFEMTSSCSEKELKKNLANFVLILNRDRALGKISEIIKSFNDIWSIEKGELSAELSSARDLGPATKDSIVEYLKNKTGAKKINLYEKSDTELIGGFILRYNSYIIDGSLKNTLNNLKNKSSK